jgi:regulator of replication initiation timing
MHKDLVSLEDSLSKLEADNNGMRRRLGDVDNFERDISQLRRRIATLESENADLRNENDRLRQATTQPYVSAKTAIVSVPPPPPSQQHQHQYSSYVMPSSKYSTKSVNSTSSYHSAGDYRDYQQYDGPIEGNEMSIGGRPSLDSHRINSREVSDKRKSSGSNLAAFIAGPSQYDKNQDFDEYPLDNIQSSSSGRQSLSGGSNISASGTKSLASLVNIPGIGINNNSNHSSSGHGNRQMNFANLATQQPELLDARSVAHAINNRPTPFATEQSTHDFVRAFDSLERQLTMLMAEKTTLTDESERYVLNFRDHCFHLLI